MPLPGRENVSAHIISIKDDANAFYTNMMSQIKAHVGVIQRWRTVLEDSFIKSIEVLQLSVESNIWEISWSLSTLMK